ncbi:uncharacterized protein [Setaria viridis]|uniref:uncharacterized protein n=1 Tax=Setaria viridis TaxID=4556 RepID=UPI003B3A44AA
MGLTLVEVVVTVEVTFHEADFMEVTVEDVGGHRRNPPVESLQRKVEGFTKLRPSTFDNSDNPLDADDWLREIEKKLDLTDCMDEECVALATHQLIGTARAWWDSFRDSHVDPMHITWDEFAIAFHEHHIPEVVMDWKADEFCNLKMGNLKVQEYANKFQELMRYAPGDSNTEKKKMYWFRKGLHWGIEIHLSAHDCPTLHALVGKALQVEKLRLEYEEV